MVRLKCPNCANVIDAAPGSMPRCPACGFMGAATPPQAYPAMQPYASAQPGTYPAHSTNSAATGRKPRPGWVLAVAILQFINGGFAILGGLLIMMAGAFFAALLAELFAPLAALAGLFVVLGIVIVVFGILYTLLATQVLKGREWARITSIVLSAISGAFSIFGLLGGNFLSLFSIAFDVLIIVGLCVPECRAWFAQETAAGRPAAVPA